MEKKRSQNFSSAEKAIFVELMRDNVADIEGTPKDLRGQQKRKAAWKTLKAQFNSRTEVSERDEQQLCTLWRKIKRDAKKDESRFRRESARTGGGPAPEPTTAITEDVKAMLPAIFKPIPGVIDDDAAMDAVLDEDDASQSSTIAATPEEATSSPEPDNTPRQRPQTQPRKSSATKVSKVAGDGTHLTDFASLYHQELLHCLHEEHDVKMTALRRDAELREREHGARMELFSCARARLEKSEDAGQDDCQGLQAFTSALRYL